MSEGFEKAIHTAIEKSLLKLLSDTPWATIDYRDRFKIPESWLKECWKLVSTDAVKAQLAKRLETELVNEIMNKIAQELSRDIKLILGNQERREEVRALARNYVEGLVAGGAK